MENYVKESRGRAVFKALSWRLFGTLDTFLFSWLFTEQLGHASSIASIDTVVKLILYYFHERLWQNVPLGFFRNKIYGESLPIEKITKTQESHTRSVIKSLSWRLVGSFTTVLIAYMILGDTKLAWSLGGTEFISKFILYYLHERLWQLIPRGNFRKIFQR